VAEVEAVRDEIPTRLLAIEENFSDLQEGLTNFLDTDEKIGDEIRSIGKSMEDFSLNLERAVNSAISEIDRQNLIRVANIERWKEQISVWESESLSRYRSVLDDGARDWLNFLASLRDCVEERQSTGFYYKNSSECLEPMTRLAVEGDTLGATLEEIASVETPSLILAEADDVKFDPTLADRIVAQLESDIARAAIQIESAAVATAISADELMSYSPSVGQDLA
jgi:hypothetical protein